MNVELFQLTAGLGMLVVGGELLVSGALSLGRVLHLSSWITGATLVAFSTSAPELTVNVIAARQGHTGLAFGNVIGSNIANVGLVLGVAAIIHRIPLGQHQLERRLLLFSLAAVLALAFDELLRGDFARIGWIEACVLLSGFVFYVSRLLKNSSNDCETETQDDAGWLRASLLAVAGFALLAFGGRIGVAAAVGLATHLGVPPTILGLSVVAIGTSLPELFASLAALRRGETDLLLGTILGSNLFNLLLVLSVTALIRPVLVPAGGVADLLAMAAFSAVLLHGGRGNSSFSRLHGAALLLAYIGYLSSRIVFDPIS